MVLLNSGDLKTCISVKKLGVIFLLRIQYFHILIYMKEKVKIVFNN